MGHTDPNDPLHRPDADTKNTQVGIVKKWGKMRHAQKTLLIVDSDKDPTAPSPDTGNRVNNWPDPGNNHGAAGQNIGFGDGHVAWVARGSQIIRTWLDGYQGLAQDSAFTMSKLPGLQMSSHTGGGYTYTMH
jgi:prepilin-type processing-associated H-X9-DG protein